MKTVELSVWERVQLAQYINRSDAKADLSGMKQALKVLDILELTEEEKAEIGWTDEPTFLTCPHCQADIQTSPDGIGRWTDAEKVWELEFEDADFGLLKSATTFNWPTSLSKLLVPMLEKLTG